MRDFPRAPLRGAYCTIVARNYLPQALTLYESIRRHEPLREFVILVVDGPREEIAASRPRLRFVGLDALGLSDREALDLATIYDVVELSTGVKPLLLKRLLDEFEQVVYLDPDTYLVSPLSDLESLVDQHAVVLTPHVLEPIPPGESFLSEINTLTVGVHNLGFCAVGRGGVPFLDWWWSHLERECLIYPLLGLFVDQKWTDIGSVMFRAHSLEHYGYNIGHWNLHERQFQKSGSEYVMERSGEPLRLLHFSGFNPRDPDSVSVRQNVSLKDKGLGSIAYSELSREYADLLLKAEGELGPKPHYAFARDQSGRLLTKRVRRTFRQDLLSGGDGGLPSPFVPEERQAFARWRITSYRRRMSGAAADAAIGFKYAFPDAYARVKSRLPRQFGRMRSRLLQQSNIRR
jgi:hypothetical protein